MSSDKPYQRRQNDHRPLHLFQGGLAAATGRKPDWEEIRLDGDRTTARWFRAEALPTGRPCHNRSGGKSAAERNLQRSEFGSRSDTSRVQRPRFFGPMTAFLSRRAISRHFSCFLLAQAHFVLGSRSRTSYVQRPPPRFARRSFGRGSVPRDGSLTRDEDAVSAIPNSHRFLQRFLGVAR